MGATIDDSSHPRNTTRTVPAGLLAMVAVLLLAGVLFPDARSSVVWSVGQAVLAFFLAALAGAWLARGRFAGPALLVWTVFWALVVWLLSPAGTALLQSNWLAILLSGAAAVAGALCGQVLTRNQAA